MSRFSRRDLINSILKGSLTLPFAFSPLKKYALGQSSQNSRPLRFITITLPYSPRTETNDGTNSADNFIRIMWNNFPQSLRPYTRFFSNFSYNIEEPFWHGLAGYSYLFTCNPVPNARANPSDNPQPVSLDYEIARLIGESFQPYANLQASALDPVTNLNMPLTLFGHKPYWGEYTGSDDLYFPPTTGFNLDAEANFGSFLSYRPNGTVKNPLYAGSANAYASIFGVQNNNTGMPVPESSFEQVLRLIHDSDIGNYIDAKEIEIAQESHSKILDLQTRINKHTEFLRAQREGSLSSACSSVNIDWPGVEAQFNDVNAYNFEAIKQVIRCDQHRVINFAFTDSEATGMSFIDANGLNGTNIPGLTDIEIHNATHREIGGISLNNDRMNGIYSYFYRQIGQLLSDLEQMPEPLAPGSGQSVLDNTIVYITGTTGFPGVHSANNMAIALVGGGRYLENGSHLLPTFTQNGNDDYASHVFDGSEAYDASFPSYGGDDKVANLQLSLLKLFGSDRTVWGHSGGRTFSDARSNNDTDLINFARPGTSAQYRMG